MDCPDFTTPLLSPDRWSGSCHYEIPANPRSIARPRRSMHHNNLLQSISHCYHYWLLSASEENDIPYEERAANTERLPEVSR